MGKNLKGIWPLRIGTTILLLFVIFIVFMVISRILGIAYFFDDYYDMYGQRFLIIYFIIIVAHFLIAPIFLLIALLRSHNGTGWRRIMAFTPLLAYLAVVLIICFNLGIIDNDHLNVNFAVFNIIFPFLVMLTSIERFGRSRIGPIRWLRIALTTASLYLLCLYIMEEDSFYEMIYEGILVTIVILITTIILFLLTFDIFFERIRTISIDPDNGSKETGEDECPRHQLLRFNLLMLIPMVGMPIVILFASHDSIDWGLAIVLLFILPLVILVNVRSLIKWFRNLLFKKRPERKKKRSIANVMASSESHDRWSRRLVSLILVLIGMTLLPLSLEQSGRYGYLDMGPEIFLFSALVLLIAVLYPYQVWFLNRKKYPTVQFCSLAVTLIVLSLITGILGEVHSDYGLYVYLDGPSAWMLFIPLPVITSLLAPLKGSFFTTKRRNLLIGTSLVSFFGAVLAYLFFNHPSFLSSFWKPSMHVIYLIPIVFGLIVLVYDFEEKARPTGSRLLTYLKRIGSNGLTYFVILVILLALLRMDLSYGTWHEYDYREKFPEGTDGYIATTALSQELELIVHDELYQDGYFLDPNLITIEIIDDFKQWVLEARDGREWGDYYVTIEVTVRTDTNLSIGHRLANNEDDHRESPHTFRFNIAGEETELEEMGRWGSSLVYVLDDGTYGIINRTGYWGPWMDNDSYAYFDNIDIVYAELHYGIQSAPLAGYGGSIYQYIGMKDEQILFLYAERSNWIS